MRDLALQKCRVLAKRLQHCVLVLAKQWLHEHRRVAKIWRHAHFRDADEVRAKDVVMDFAALEEVAEDMAYLLAHPKQPDRASFLRFLPTHQQLTPMEKGE